MENSGVLFHILIIVCSSLTPILILISGQDWKIFAVVTSFIVAISTSFITTFKIKEKWLKYRTIAEEMRREHVLYKTCAGKYSNMKDKQVLFVENVEAILSDGVKNWFADQQNK